MAFRDKLRATAGSIRAFPMTGRRIFELEMQMEELRGKNASSFEQRLSALESQVERLHELMRSVDPQATFEIVSAVRDEVAELTIEVAEHLNRSSALLAAADVTPEKA